MTSPLQSGHTIGRSGAAQPRPGSSCGTVSCGRRGHGSAARARRRTRLAGAPRAAARGGGSGHRRRHPGRCPPRPLRRRGRLGPDRHGARASGRAQARPQNGVDPAGLVPGRVGRAEAHRRGRCVAAPALRPVRGRRGGADRDLGAAAAGQPGRCRARGLARRARLVAGRVRGAAARVRARGAGLGRLRDAACGDGASAPAPVARRARRRDLARHADALLLLLRGGRGGRVVVGDAPAAGRRRPGDDRDRRRNRGVPPLAPELPRAAGSRPLSLDRPVRRSPGRHPSGRALLRARRPLLRARPTRPHRCADRRSDRGLVAPGRSERGRRARPAPDRRRRRRLGRRPADLRRTQPSASGPVPGHPRRGGGDGVACAPRPRRGGPGHRRRAVRCRLLAADARARRLQLGRARPHGARLECP